jgi:hypothetical protein
VLLDVRERLTPANHQTHRPYPFTVPERCRQLDIHVSYAPKLVSPSESASLVAAALASQRTVLRAQVGEALADRWMTDHAEHASRSIVENLLSISLDDAAGTYRGAGHRHAADQHLMLGVDAASPGLVPGELLAGTWTLTLSAHTLVSAQCELSIQIGAEIA